MKEIETDMLVREKLDALDTLSGGIVYAKEEAWERLQTRMEAKPGKRIGLYYGMAAAVLLIVGGIVVMWMGQPTKRAGVAVSVEKHRGTVHEYSAKVQGIESAGHSAERTGKISAKETTAVTSITPDRTNDPIVLSKLDPVGQQEPVLQLNESLAESQQPKLQIVTLSDLENADIGAGRDANKPVVVTGDLPIVTTNELLGRTFGFADDHDKLTNRNGATSVARSMFLKPKTEVHYHTAQSNTHALSKYPFKLNLN